MLMNQFGLFVCVLIALNLVVQAQDIIKIPIEVHNTGSSLLKHKSNTLAAIANETLTNYNLLYIGSISIGTPAQNFTVIFTTVTPLFWIVSSKCVNPGCLFPHKYNSSKSTTYAKTSTSFTTTNINGNIVNGTYSSDTVRIATTTVTKQYFAEMTSLDTYTNGVNNSWDGMIGLGFVGPVNPVISNMWAQNQLPRNAFSLFVNKNTSAKTGGMLILGGSDPTYYSGNFTYANLTSKTANWQIKIDSLKVGNKNSTVCSGGCQALISSSSSYISGPLADVLSINAQLGAVYQNGLYSFNCATVNTLPNVTFTFGGKPIVLTSSSYIWKSLGYCVSGFIGINGTNQWLLGHSFLSTFYTEFDVAKLRVGFATAKTIA